MRCRGERTFRASWKDSSLRSFDSEKHTGYDNSQSGSGLEVFLSEGLNGICHRIWLKLQQTQDVNETRRFDDKVVA